MSGLPADVFVPVPLRFRHVIPGDVFLGRDGSLWAVTERGPSQRTSYGVVAVQGANQVAVDVDPDETVQVLVPVTERDAVELTRAQLGARLVERRTA